MSDNDNNDMPTIAEVNKAIRLATTIKLSQRAPILLKNYNEMMLWCAAAVLDCEHIETLLGSKRHHNALTIFLCVYTAIFGYPKTDNEKDTAANVLTITSDALWEMTDDTEKEALLAQLKGTSQ